MKLIFDDSTFSLQLLRAISETYYKGADIGECLSTAYKIKESDFESWYNEWLKTAEFIIMHKNVLKMDIMLVREKHFLEHRTTIQFLDF